MSYQSSAILPGSRTPRTALRFHAHVAQSHTNMCMCFQATQEADWEEVKLLEQDAKPNIAWTQKKQLWLDTCYWQVHGPVQKTWNPKLTMPAKAEDGIQTPTKKSFHPLVLEQEIGTNLFGYYQRKERLEIFCHMSILLREVTGSLLHLHWWGNVA